MRATSPGSEVTEITDNDVLDKTMDDLAARGFEPVLICFRSPSGEVELLTRKIDLQSFVTWLLTTWIPASRDRTREPGH
jgi:hypothetical protein